jgi:hypothetical protein
VVSLEHEIRYATRVQRYLHKHRLDSVRLCVAPIAAYDEFDWYSLPPPASIAEKFSLVISDGPPETTRGGRYGLVPVMLERLRTGCVILLDDGAREGEQVIAARWAKLLHCVPEYFGTEKPYIRLQAGLPPSSIS